MPRPCLGLAEPARKNAQRAAQWRWSVAAATSSSSRRVRGGAAEAGVRAQDKPDAPW